MFVMYAGLVALVLSAAVKAPFVYDSQQACERATGKACGFVMCDYIPAGKTFDEVCGKDFQEGWAPNNQPVQPSHGAEFSVRTPVIGSVEDLRASWPRDAVMIRAAEASGDVLYLDVQHGGGCKEHDYKLGINSMFNKSMPARVRVVFAHDSRGDMCEAAVSQRVAFDLSALKAKYMQTFPNGQRVVELLIEGFAQPVRYSFE